MGALTRCISVLLLLHFISSNGIITPQQYDELTQEITTLINEKNCAPILVRLAWHDAGTYDKESQTGGPRAAQRFDAGESKHAANNGLDIARNLLQPLVDKYCKTNIISIADLWALAGTVTIKVAGGPTIPFRFGRKDITDASECVEDGRLPDATQGVDHLRSVFQRIGFMADAWIVALSGAHTLGSCHADRSGFEGPWTQNPYKFDNSYFKDLLRKKWKESKCASTGAKQYTSDEGTMMLPSDMDLLNVPITRLYVQKYATDEEVFFKDFSTAWKILIESGYDADDLYTVSSSDSKDEL